MRHTFLFVLVLVLGSACNPESAKDAAKEAAATNILSEEEAADGWALLFDGESTDGWHRYGSGDAPSARWQVGDGLLKTDRSDGQMAGTDMLTDDVFTSFELSLEFKVDSGGNSGVFYRVLETDEAELWQNAPEYQVIDDPSYMAIGALPEHLTASNYDLHPSVGGHLNPAGEWNSGRILIDGDHVEHWLNGVKVVSYTFDSEDWMDRVAASKFGEYPHYGKTVEGRIALQDHGEAVAYRNIKIRRLE